MLNFSSPTQPVRAMIETNPTHPTNDIYPTQFTKWVQTHGLHPTGGLPVQCLLPHNRGTLLLSPLPCTNDTLDPPRKKEDFVVGHAKWNPDASLVLCPPLRPCKMEYRCRYDADDWWPNSWCGLYGRPRPLPNRWPIADNSCWRRSTMASGLRHRRWGRVPACEPMAPSIPTRFFFETKPTQPVMSKNPFPPIQSQPFLNPTH
jgi:hypothetical protein